MYRLNEDNLPVVFIFTDSSCFLSGRDSDGGVC